MKVTMSNRDIYLKYNILLELFNNSKTQYLPARVNYLIQKNYSVLERVATLIENSRTKIIEFYGEPENENGIISIQPEKIELANKELDEILSLQEEIDVFPIKLSDLEMTEFTLEQMQALFYMIEED